MSGMYNFATSAVPAFSVTELTAMLLQVPPVPTLVSSLDLFVARPIATTSIGIEAQNDLLALVSARPRGAPANRNVMGQRSLTPFRIPHFPLSDTLMADSIQDQRGLGTMELQSWQTALQERLASMSRKLDATEEHLRFSAARGRVVTEVDRITGEVLASVDLFAEFNIVPPESIAFPMAGPGARTADAAWGGAIMAACRQVVRTMQTALGHVPPRIAGICGSAFFDALSGAAELRQTRLGTPAAGELRRDVLFQAVEYGGISFYDYGAAGVGNFAFMPPDECQFVPLAVPGLFVQAYSPAPYIDAVNQLAMPRYARQEFLDFGKGVEIETQINTLPICCNPKVLLTGRLTPAASGAAAAAAGRKG